MLIYTENKDSKWVIIELGLKLLINALVLLMAASIFKGFFIGGFLYAVLGALIIMILDMTIKPFIKILTLPITVYTLGLFYPFVNVIILKITNLIIGSNFVVEGWIVPFFISIFISFMNLILDITITKQIVRSK